MLHHPDKGGDPERFKEITYAYEVLGDPDKRRIYDERGEEYRPGQTDPVDIFEMFFGRGASGRRRNKNKNVVHSLSVSLQQLYSGCTRKLAINREVVDRDKAIQSCRECNGTGMHSNMLQRGGAMQPAQGACRHCVGMGKVFSTKKEREILEVYVEKGTPHGHKIVFPGKGDEHPDVDPGDVVIIIHEQEHADFRRRGADLFIAREIGLLEALTGFKMLITHLDQRQFIVKTVPGEVIQPLSQGTGLKAVQEEGMPFHRNPFLFGNLFLVLTIRFPDSISSDLVPKLKEALPGPPEQEEKDMEVSDTDSIEFCQVEDMDPVESAKANAGHHQPDARGEEDHKLPSGGCPQQ